MPQLTVVIPTYSSADTLMAGIASLVDQTAAKPEIIVVDNASPARLDIRVRQEFGTRARILRLPRNTFYCGAANAGARLAQTPHLAILNDDAWVDPDWAEAIVTSFDERPRAGSVASLVRQAGRLDLVDSAGDHLDIRGRPSNLFWNTEVSGTPVTRTPVFSAAGSCAAFRTEAFARAGGFDEDFVAYLDDIDLGFRLQLLGYESVFDPDAKATHVGGGTKKRRAYAAKLTERNIIWNLIKNMPATLALDNLASILWSTARPTPLVGGPSVEGWSRGLAEAMVGVPRFLRKRRGIQANRVVSDSYVRELLSMHPVTDTHL